MSMPNPQYDQILGFLSKRPFAFYDLTHVTRYFLEDTAEGEKELDCLGMYEDMNAALFGEWYGLEENRPSVDVNKLDKCLHAFMTRSVTDDEATGFRRAVVLLEVKNVERDPNGYAAKVVFQKSKNIGYYNPIV